MPRKGLKNSSYALVITLAFISGLMLLSFSGNPYSLAGQSNMQEIQENVDTEQIQENLPEDTPFNAGNYLNTGQQNLESPSGSQEIIKAIAEGLMQGSGDKQREKSSDGNNTSEPSNGGNQTSPSQNQTIDGGNQTDNQEDSETGNQSTEDSQENSQEPDSQNSTDQNGEKQEDSQNQGNDSIESGTNSSSSDDGGGEESSGLIQDIAESVSEMFSSNSSQESSQGSQRESQNNQGQSSESGSSSSGIVDTLSDSKRKLFAVLAVLAALTCIALLYRTDESVEDVLRSILRRLRSFVKSIPDLVTRYVVKSVRFLSQKVMSLNTLIREIIRSPAEKAGDLQLWLKEKLDQFKELLQASRDEGLHKVLGNFVGSENRSLSGLDRLWLDFKIMLGLRDSSSRTPEEVRREAYRQEMPQEKVDSIVEAFRREKYSSEGIEKDPNLKGLIEELEEEIDEQD